MAHLQRHPRSHRPQPARLSSRACTSLYTYPTSTDTLPVYESLTLTWDPSCLDIDSSTIDVYLSIQEESGWLPVREWTGATYSAGQLETQLKPGWWNASTGAGSVSGQLSIVPSGQPSWNTPAPAGPVFTIAYNGSYPSVTSAAAPSSYTGPSVESVEDKSSSSPSGGKLGAAIAVPILVVALAVVAYVTWNRMRKRPEKKRFSAVVDHRMSMISQGTWQPRPSMASRPGSFHPTHRPSGSQYSTANRHSYFADPANRNSTYSFAGSGVGVPSPLGAGIRAPPPAEMRQTGQGERASRISFAAGEAMPRPSMASSRHAAKPSSVHTRSSLHQSQLRNSAFLASDEPLPMHHPNRSTSSLPSPSSPGAYGPQDDYFSRSGTKEELASLRSPSSGSLKPSPLGHSHKASVASSLRHELNGMPAIAVMRDGSLAYGNPPSPALSHSPFGDPSTPASPQKPKPTLKSLSTENLSSLPLAFRSSQILSPDAALASYARDAVSPPPGARGATPPAGSSKAGGLARSAGMLFARPARMLRSLTGSSLAAMKGGAASPELREKERGSPPLAYEEHERARSPFEDPPEEDEEGGEALAPPRAIGQGARHSAAPTEGSRYSHAEEKKVDEKAAPGQAL
ncbi:hypothetical protein JCM10207_008736 [Rhodosporidiobolus poonsookiae]